MERRFTTAELSLTAVSLPHFESGRVDLNRLCRSHGAAVYNRRTKINGSFHCRIWQTGRVDTRPAFQLNRPCRSHGAAVYNRRPKINGSFHCRISTLHRYLVSYYMILRARSLSQRIYSPSLNRAFPGLRRMYRTQLAKCFSSRTSRSK